MPVRVNGNVDSKKFIVILHGGPGGSSIQYRDNRVIIDYAEKNAAIVYWDQRFAGHTQGNTGSLDIKDFRRDIFDLLTLLREKYGSDNQFYLFAHSWGGFLAPYFLMEGVNQELVSGWIQIGGAHNYRMNDSLTREMLLHYGEQEIRFGRNTDEWEDIVEWCKENGFESRTEAARLNGYAHLAETLMSDVNPPLLGLPDLLFKENIVVSAFFINLVNSGLRRIDSQTFDTPISQNLHKITIPTILLWGKYDFVCPPQLMDDIEANIGTGMLEKHIFNRSGHSPMSNEADVFWGKVIDWIERH
jgi:pimeloyl-ACP methyl ester carboxylesterase